MLVCVYWLSTRNTHWSNWWTSFQTHQTGTWKHTCTENRSTFTYWEKDIPSHIDLGKTKYGVPFTTEKVGNTKTLFSILLFSLFGFHLSSHVNSLLHQLNGKQFPDLSLSISVVSYWASLVNSMTAAWWVAENATYWRMSNEHFLFTLTQHPP